MSFVVQRNQPWRFRGRVGTAGLRENWALLTIQTYSSRRASQHTTSGDTDRRAADELVARAAYRWPLSTSRPRIVRDEARVAPTATPPESPWHRGFGAMAATGDPGIEPGVAVLETAGNPVAIGV